MYISREYNHRNHHMHTCTPFFFSIVQFQQRDPFLLVWPSNLGLCKIDSLALIMLLRDRQVRQARGHDPPGRRARHDAVLCEISHVAVVAEEVFVEQELAVDEGGGAPQDVEDGVGEDGGFPEVFLVGGGFGDKSGGGGGLDGLVGDCFEI